MRIPGGLLKAVPRKGDADFDRPLRPLFPDGFSNEVQIVAMVVSLDPDVPAMIGGRGAVRHPVQVPIVAFRLSQRPLRVESDAVAGEGQPSTWSSPAPRAVLMVESEADVLSEAIMVGAVMFGQSRCRPRSTNSSRKPSHHQQAEAHARLDEISAKAIEALAKTRRCRRHQQSAVRHRIARGRILACVDRDPHRHFAVRGRSALFTRGLLRMVVMTRRYDPCRCFAKQCVFHQPGEQGRRRLQEREFDMATTVAQKAQIMSECERAARDAGSSEVRVALRGLLRMVVMSR